MKARITRTLAACLALAAASTASSAFAATVTTNASNPAAIAILEAQPGSPYPSTINVAGLSGTVTAVTVTLNGFSHTWPSDVDILLVSPGGQSIMLMSEAGGSGDVSNSTLTFSATAGAGLGSPIVSGTYLPTDAAGGDVMQLPAPIGPYSIDLTTLNGPATAQNGAWQLFVRDDAGIDVGSIANGWTLAITQETFTTCAAEGFIGAKLTLCRQVCEINQPPSRLASLIKLYMAIYRTEPPCAL